MEQVILGLVLGFAIALTSYISRLLTFSGAVAAFFLAAGIFGVGGWKWTVPIFTFFCLSSLLSKVGQARKARFASVFEKSGTRDHGQVLANGGVAGFLALWQLAFPAADFYPVYLGAVAAATADTWATEIGLLTRGKTFSIASFRTVDQGISGGVSWLGLSAGLLGAGVIAGSAFFWVKDMRILGFVAAAGFVASLIDSILGATIQAEYECTVCGRSTERKEHCGMPAKLVKGYPAFDNDTVNWLCAFAGAMAVWSFQNVFLRGS